MQPEESRAAAAEAASELLVGLDKGPDDGKVDGVGSVWRIYFPEGSTPSEYSMTQLTGAVKATMINEAEYVARVTPTEGK